MTRLLVATRSRGKQAEFKTLLAPLPFQLIFPDEAGIVESPDEHDLERFDSFEENARAKARWFSRRSGLPTLADDSGLEVDFLHGAPGVRSKRFAGLEGPDDQVATANNSQLLQQLAGVPERARTARYRCVLVLVNPESGRLPAIELVAAGTVEGRIAEVALGSAGFGYDPLFISDELGRTFGEATATEKHAISHRARAVTALGGMIRESCV